MDETNEAPRQLPILIALLSLLAPAVAHGVVTSPSVRLAVVPAGTRVYAQPSAAARFYRVPIDWTLPVEIAGEGWLRVRTHAKLAPDTFFCTARGLEEFDVTFFFRESDLPLVATRLVSVSFADGTAGTVAPGEKLTPTGPTTRGVVPARVEHTGATIQLDAPEDAVGRTYAPAPYAPPAGFRRDAGTFKIYRLAVNGRPVTTKERIDALEETSGLDGLFSEEAAFAVKATGNRKLLVSVSSLCGFYTALTAKQAKPISIKGLSVIGSLRENSPDPVASIAAGTPLFLPDGTAVGRTATDLKLTDEASFFGFIRVAPKRAPAGLSCFLPHGGAVHTSFPDDEMLTLCTRK